MLPYGPCIRYEHFCGTLNRINAVRECVQFANALRIDEAPTSRFHPRPWGRPSVTALTTWIAASPLWTRIPAMEIVSSQVPVDRKFYSRVEGKSKEAESLHRVQAVGGGGGYV